MLTDRLRQAETPTLSIGYAELGPSEGPAVLLLHGWPYDIHTYADAGPLLADRGFRVIVPFQRGFGTTRFRDAAAPDVGLRLRRNGLTFSRMLRCRFGAERTILRPCPSSRGC